MDKESIQNLIEPKSKDMEEKNKENQPKQKDPKQEGLDNQNKILAEYKKAKKKEDKKKMLENDKTPSGDVKTKATTPTKKVTQKESPTPSRKSKGYQNLGYNKNDDRVFRDLTKPKPEAEKGKSTEEQNLDALNEARSNSEGQENDQGLER